MQGSEWKYLLIISFVFALPSLLSLFAPFTIEEYDVHHKIFELQADINSFLYQQKLLTMTQQNITLILSNLNNKLIENENLLLSCQSSPNDLQNQTKGDRLLEELMDEIIDLSKLLRVSLKNIENLQNQLPKLEQQIPILDSQGVQIIEQVVSNLIFEELQKGINSSYQSNESFALLNEHMYNFSHGQLTDIVSKVSEQIQNRTQTSQTSNDYFEFPNVDIIAIVNNFTSPTYQVHQNGIFPSLGINPKLMIGGPEKVISSNLSLGECWAMEV